MKTFWPKVRLSVYAARVIPGLASKGPHRRTVRRVCCSAADSPQKDTIVITSSSRDVPGAGSSLVAATETEPAAAADLDVILQKLKLLEFGLYGLQQFGRNARLDVEDLGPFYRLAEEIASDVVTLRQRLTPVEPSDPAVEAVSGMPPGAPRER